jgi:2'-hydroxyisoflavone reductase
MRILVIGGTQFISRRTVQRLVGDGHEVSVLHRRDHHDLGAGVRNLQADRGDLDTVARIMGEHEFDAVFDFAYDWEKGTPPEHVVAAARNCADSLHRYVFMSSIAAYGGGLDLREDQPLAPDDHPNPYVRHKAAAERALFRMHAESGFPVTTFRPPFVHGPGQVFYREPFFWDRLLDRRPIILPDGGDDLMEWAYVGDVADACVRALDVPGGGRRGVQRGACRADDAARLRGGAGQRGRRRAEVRVDPAGRDPCSRRPGVRGQPLLR